MAKRNCPVQKNQTLDVQIQDLTYQGMGLAKVDGYSLFIEDALPGEEMAIKVISVGKNFGFGKVVERYTDSPNRVTTVDKMGTQTGTMPLQHLVYEKQLEFKQGVVKDNFKRNGGLEDVEVLPTLGMENPWGYRNKAQIPVQEKEGRLVTGFYRKRSHDLIPVENFYIQDPEIDKAIVKVRDILNMHHVQAYDEKSHKGTIRHIIVRRGYYSHEMMIILVTNGWKLSDKSIIVDRIKEALPEVVSIVQNNNSDRTNVILGKESKALYGEDLYHDSLLGLNFAISSQSFFQINPTQTEKLYQTALDFADLKGTEVVVDAYCGIGTISLALAQKAKKVYAMEIVSDAIEMAKKNAKANQIDNVHFEVGAAEEIMPRWVSEGINPDVIVVDPPRKGLEQSFIDAAVEVQPEKIIYVSCDPSTLARDLGRFEEQGYKAIKAQPVDMFPQTVHIESVVLLTKN